jgi:hypothetical protein
MTANDAGAVIGVVMGDPAGIDSQGTLARQHFRLNPTSQLLPLSPHNGPQGRGIAGRLSAWVCRQYQDRRHPLKE